MLKLSPLLILKKHFQTYNNNKQVPDSASTATAIFTGVKNNQTMLGEDATVNESDGEDSPREEARLTTRGQLEQEAGRSTGTKFIE